MSFPPLTILWFVAAALSSIALAKLMRRRQSQLIGVLRTYVDAQLEWSRKRAKAAQLARRAARHKAALEAEESHGAATLSQDGYNKYDQPAGESPADKALVGKAEPTGRSVNP